MPDTQLMSDMETELETLNRLEVALARIGEARANLAPKSAIPPMAGSADPTIIATLDQVIGTLRAALNEPDIDKGA